MKDRNYLFSPELADAELGDFAVLATGWPQLNSEQRALAFAERDEVVELRHEFRQFLREVQADASPTPKHQNAARVATLALRSLDRELDLRTEAGDPGPRARPGRQTDPSASDNPNRPIARASAPAARSNRMGDVYAPGGGGLNGFASFGAFALAAVRDPTDPRLRNAVSTLQREGVGADGGFAVAPQWVDQLLDGALEEEVIRPRSNVVPVTSNPVVFPAFDLSSNADAKRGGVQLKWMGEAASGTDQAARLRDITMNMSKGAIFISLSSEVFEDMVNAAKRISNIMSAALAAGLDYSFVNGTGTGQPQGILASPALVTQTKESGQASGTLLLANLAKMISRLHPRSFRNATWLIHPTTIPALVNMSVTVRNLAGTEVVGGSFVPAVTFAPDGQLMIFGRPAIPTDACAPLGSLGDIILCDLSRYLIAVRREATLQTSIHANWSQDLYAMRLIIRLSGCTEDSAVTTLRDGTSTVSPFVALEAR
jgi:HK97 family phage major capsid protein